VTMTNVGDDRYLRVCKNCKHVVYKYGVLCCGKGAVLPETTFKDDTRRYWESRRVTSESTCSEFSPRVLLG